MFEFITKLFRSSPAQAAQPLPTLDDPLFGPLVYFPAANLWSGKIHFPPLEREVEVLIDAQQTGPEEAQRQFFQDTLTRWPEIQTAIGEVLFPPIKQWAKADYDESNPWGYFNLRGIRIPSTAATPKEWAISYWCPSVKHHFDVQMLDWAPDGLDITRK